ncbi:MAG TPA: DNA cytosine methyltransferase, partial [Pirellulales bacterium]|nr:DNA cytosine methyltransferase [Pirellulales bacterium]
MGLARNEIIVDSFAGGGGASLGILQALGRGPDVAINHDPGAIAMHAANHPETLHLSEDVWRVSPQSVLRICKRRGRWQLPPEGWREWPATKRVGLLWASPDCKHFSRAKGSKPVNKNIRSLAWVVCKWAAEVRPRVNILENVREFAEWGPVVPAWRCGACNWRGTEGQAVLARTRRRCPRCESLKLARTDELIPDPDRKGLTFRRWVGRLKNLGYRVEWKNLNAADYGAPTHRRRLFLVARADGAPIVWPEPTHGDPKKLDALPLFDRLQPWRTAAECIDWSLPCPSIFDRKRPLAEATMRRIAMGIKRYVLETAEPFIVGVGGRMGQTPASSVDEPSNTVTAKNDRGIVVPVLASLAHGGG